MLLSLLTLLRDLHTSVQSLLQSHSHSSPGSCPSGLSCPDQTKSNSSLDRTFLLCEAAAGSEHWLWWQTQLYGFSFLSAKRWQSVPPWRITESEVYKMPRGRNIHPAWESSCLSKHSPLTYCFVLKPFIKPMNLGGWFLCLGHRFSNTVWIVMQGDTKCCKQVDYSPSFSLTSSINSEI